jgi:hypothetical protein
MFGWFRQTREPTDGNTWVCEFFELAGTEFHAVAGPWGSRNPVSYSVAVEKKESDGTCISYFMAKYALAGLSPGFSSKPIAEIVRFDPKNGTVEFDLGGQCVWCKLPDLQVFSTS